MAPEGSARTAPGSEVAPEGSASAGAGSAGAGASARSGACPSSTWVSEVATGDRSSSVSCLDAVGAAVGALGTSAAWSGRASAADAVCVGVVVGVAGRDGEAAVVAGEAGRPGSSAPSSSSGGGRTVAIQSESLSFSWVISRMSYSAYSNSRLQKSAS